MNLPQFLKKIDAALVKMSNEDMKNFIHEIARTYPEDRRKYFLNVISQKNLSKNNTQELAENDFISEQTQIKQALNKINDGVVCLDSKYNNEWDEWNDEDSEQILFTDPDGLLADVEKAVNFVHKCIDMEAYKKGYEFVKILSDLEISAYGDYEEFYENPLTLGELDDYKLLKFSFMDFFNEALFLSYINNKLSDRPKKLYEMMTKFGCDKVKFQNIFQVANNALPDFEEFLLLWIDYLGNLTDENYGRIEELMLNAQSMLEDEEQQLNAAKKFSEQHPKLYQQILQNKPEAQDKDGNKKKFQIGLEALENIPQLNFTRSEIALLTAEYAVKINDIEGAEKCWFEAFRSNSSVVNYMRLKALTRDNTKYDDEIKKICAEILLEMNEAKYYERRLIKTVWAILFFERDFENVFKNGMNVKEALGWSSTFMKEGIAMFMLLMFEKDILPKGLTEMLNKASSGCAFGTKEYIKGTNLNEQRKDQEVFWDFFSKWKKDIKISETTKTKWLKKIENLIHVRVVGIMEANNTKYYDECASFIAAFGEVQESRGVENYKAESITAYKNEYSRRRSFHKALNNYE